jgi:pyruvate ferredoxin oxidoreductase gamma subunit/2-oxoisovalerate ferredoxin oxidoreductase gamma subunit
MVELRFHGRGGQGAVVASKIFAVASFKSGYYPLAFPQFGVERRGAPVNAFLRIFHPEEKLFVRCNVYNPDGIIVLDMSLLEMINVTEGLKEGGFIILNTSKDPSEFKFNNYKVYTVDATNIAIKYKLGSRAQPIVNTALTGALAKVLNIFSIDVLKSAIAEEVPLKIEENQKAAEEAYNSVKS